MYKLRSPPAVLHASFRKFESSQRRHGLLVTAEKKFWRSVVSGERPRLFGVEAPRPALEAVRIVDMGPSNSSGRPLPPPTAGPAHQAHEGAKAELKKLVPEDAGRPSAMASEPRAPNRAVSFEPLEAEAPHAPL
jgi:hypothetical protein